MKPVRRSSFLDARRMVRYEPLHGSASQAV